VNVLADVVTVCVPLSPADIGSELPATSDSCVCEPVVPAAVPEVLVIAMLPNSRGSQTRTGTATVRNLVPTEPEATVDEITTSFLPVAWAVVAAESLTTVTVSPAAVSRLWIAESAPLRVVLPTTSRAAPVATALSTDASGSDGCSPQPTTIKLAITPAIS
jgi:hypothetical protein